MAISIEEVRNVGEPRRPYNWEINIDGDDTLKILAQSVTFPTDNLSPRDVTQGNLQFAIYADRNLGTMNITFFEIDNGYVTSWFSDWAEQCINRDGIVVPVLRVAKTMTITELCVDKSESTSYLVLVVPINDSQFQRNDDSGPVLVELSFQLLNIMMIPDGSGYASSFGEQAEKLFSRSDRSMDGNGYSLGPIGSDGSGGYAPIDIPLSSPVMGGDGAGPEIIMPDGEIMPIVSTGFQGGGPLPSIDDLATMEDVNFANYDFPPPASVAELQDPTKWSYWPGIGVTVGMNIPFPVGMNLRINGINITTGLAKFRIGIPPITVSVGGVNDSAGGIVGGGTVYATTYGRPAPMGTIIGDFGALQAHFNLIDSSTFSGSVVLDVGRYVSLGSLGGTVNVNLRTGNLGYYGLNPIRVSAVARLHTALADLSIRIPPTVIFR